MQYLSTISTRDQTFTTVINQTRYEFHVYWNSRIEQFYMDISIDDTLTVAGIALVYGADLVNHFNIPLRDVYGVNFDDIYKPLVYDNMGTTSLIVYLEQENLENVRTIQSSL